MIKSLFGVLIKLVDVNERKKYIEVLNNLPGYIFLPLESDEYDGNIITEGIGAGKKPEKGAMILGVGYETGTKKAARRDYGNKEKENYGFPDTEFSPLFPAGIAGLADRETPLFNALINEIYIHHNAADSMFWCMTPIYLSRLGMSELLYPCIRDIVSEWVINPQGLGTDGFLGVTQTYCRNMVNSVRNVETGKITEVESWNFRYFDFETVPIIATAVNESLLQSYDGIIRILPAVEPGQDISFSLYAEGGFKVNVELHSGYVITVEARGEGGKCLIKLPDFLPDANIYIKNPWTDGFVYHDIKKVNVGSEPVYDLGDILHTGGIALLSDVRIENLKCICRGTEKPNRHMKTCGKARLGSPELL